MLVAGVTGRLIFSLACTQISELICVWRCTGVLSGIYIFKPLFDQNSNKRVYFPMYPLAKPQLTFETALTQCTLQR